MHDEQPERQRDREDDQLEVVEEVLVGQVDAGQFGRGDAGDALGAAGELGVGDPVRERERQPEGDDAEVVRLHPQRRQADQQADRGRGDECQRRGGPEPETGLGGQDRRGVGADAEERDLGEVDLPGDTHGQPEPDRQQREQDRHVRDMDGVRIQSVRQQPRGYGERDQPADPVPHARFTVLSPKIPVGRTMMTTVKTRKVTSSE